MKLLNYFLHPKKVILSLYGILSLFLLIAYVWLISFTWEYFESWTDYVIKLAVIILVGFVIATLLDSKFKWQIKYYFIISAIQLVIICSIANPVRAWQISSSLEKAKHIIEPLETYKSRFGQYPSTLTELGQKLNQNIPDRTNIGTRYSYNLIKQDYHLSFLSYYGYTAYWNNESNQWVITD